MHGIACGNPDQSTTNMQADTKPSLETRYQFHSMVGYGGAGEVFAAWDDRLKRTVAIKRMRTDGIADDVLNNPWQEAMRLASIRHSNIVTIYDMGSDDGIPYIVMEFVQGETVDCHVAKGIFTLPDFNELARQTLDGLIAAHHAGLVHRDLKPTNIMLSRLPSGAFQVKILDFGMAKFIASPSVQTINIDGTINGSVHFISPEQLNRQPVDARSDLYSLGCVFYYALCGHEPFSGTTVAAILTAHMSHDVVPLEQYRPDLPPLLCQWVMALINLQPEHRYQNAKEALEALSAILAPTQSFAVPVSSTTTIITPPAELPNASGDTGEIPQASPPPQQSQREPAAVAPRTPLTEKKGAIAMSLLAGVILVGILGGGWLLSGRNWGAANQRAGSTSGLAPTSPEAPVANVAPAKPVEAPAPVPAPVIATAPVVPAVAPTPAPVAIATPAPAAIPAPVVVPAEIVFRVHGSNTVGAALLPALMEEFLKTEGATGIQRKPGKTAEDLSIEAVLPGETIPKAIEICAHGSKTAFDDLLAGTCDLGMSSRPIKNDEAAAVAAANLGDLHSPSYEHVLGLDGIAILVNKENTVSSLTRQTIAKIFTGEITDWSQAGGQPGPIHLYARDAKSGTFDTFKTLVLEASELSPEARRFEDSNELSDAVSADPAGIGFTGLPFVRDAKALAVSDAGAQPLIATRFTVATEDYLLSRRLYLYTSTNLRSPWTRKFVQFALSDAGQEIVQKAGFVKQTPDLARTVVPAEAPKEYLEAIKDAERLSLNLRFRAGSSQLDNKALRDLDRITNMLTLPRFQGGSLVLLGFADGQGSASVNLGLSKDRAQMIAREFEARGITVASSTGLGSVLPIATNDTEAGRDKNRRVEVWLKSSGGYATRP